MMKRILLFLPLLVLAAGSLAQTQQGIVKTRGRMVNGRLQPGVGLPGATVQLADRSVLTKEGAAGKGTFSFPARGNSYRVKGVQKQGYQLVDMQACRDYKYSADTLYLVMETPEQQQSDLLAAERKIRRNLQRQLQRKEDEIEALNVSVKEKEELLRKLYQQQSDNERLIADMAQRFSTLDYDQLDDYYRQVNDLIENGELTRADSLLRSRGDVNAQVAANLQKGQAIRAQQEQIQKADAVQRAERDEIARRCYAFYETFRQQHMNDSAAHYLAQRAVLDTTNVEWQNDAGGYIADYIADYSTSLAYFRRVLRQSIIQYGEESEWVATAYNNIGLVYDDQGDYSKALEYHLKALAIWEKVLGPEHPDVATSYNNIGSTYSSQGDYPKALEYYLKALGICEKVLGLEHADVAISYNNIGSVYESQGDYSKALEYNLKALSIREKVYGQEHPDVANSYNNIGSVYDSQGDYTKALEYYFKALAICEKVLGSEHPDVAASYNNIGYYYSYQGDYIKALEYYFKSLAIEEKVLGSEHPKVATSYNNIGSVYDSQGDYPKAFEYYLKALAIREKVFGSEHPAVATSYNNIGVLYNNQGDYPKALDSFIKALAIYEKVLGPDHPKTKLVKENIEYVREAMKQ